MEKGKRGDEGPGVRGTWRMGDMETGDNVDMETWGRRKVEMGAGGWGTCKRWNMETVGHRNGGT